MRISDWSSDVCSSDLYMFTASSSPSSVATALATLGKIKSQPGLRKQLWDNAQALYKGLSDLGFTICAAASPIIAVKLPNEEAAVFMRSEERRVGKERVRSCR